MRWSTSGDKGNDWLVGVFDADEVTEFSVIFEGDFRNFSAEELNFVL